MRSNARWTNSPSRSSSIRWSCACGAYSDRDQNQDVPYTSKKLRECYRQGAEAFGWDKRNPEPRSMRDGSELVGWGMATGIWEALQMATAVRIVLTANGHAEVACATSDIGTGTYTIMAQVAADMLGLPLENVSVKLGDSTLPHAPVEGGSWTAASVSNAIAKTSDEVRKVLLRLAKKVPGSPLAASDLEDVILVDGKIVDKKETQPRRIDRGCDAPRRRWIASSRRAPPISKTTAPMRGTRIRRSSPR